MKKLITLLLWISFYTCLFAQEPIPEDQEMATGLIFLEKAEYDSIGTTSLRFGVGEIPNSVDLSDRMPPVGNQNPQNSCVAWAVVYECRSFYEKENRDYSYYTETGEIDYTHIFSPSYVYNQINGGKNVGTNFIDAFNILQYQGVCTYQSMPYRANDWKSKPNQNQKAEAANYKIDTYRRLDLRDAISSIKGELINENPVIAASVFDKMYYNAGFNFSGSDYIWSTLGPINNMMGHAILIVGYDDDKQAFKFMNSWGSNWGNDGYGWISYNIISSVIREAYIILPNNVDDPSIVIPTPEYITTTNNQLNVSDVNNYGLNFLITNVQHNIVTDYSGITQIEIDGAMTLPDGIGNNAQIVVYFYVNNGGIKGNPIYSANSSYSLINGQVATSTPLLELVAGQNTNLTWYARIPYVAFNIPKGYWMQTPWGPQYQAVTSYLIAEPVLFIDNFPLRVGQQIPFSVTF